MAVKIRVLKTHCYLSKYAFFLFLLTFIIPIFSQTGIENLFIQGDEICKKNKKIFFCKALEYYKESKNDSCYIYSEKALMITDNIEEKHILNYIQGTCAIRKKLYKKALSRILKIPDTGIYVNLKLNQLGIIYLNLEEYDEAIMYYDRLIKKGISSKTLFGKNIYHNLGICYIHKKDYKKAKNIFDKKLDLIQKTDTSELISVKINLANLYYEQYLDDEAVPLFKEAYQLAKLFSNLELKQNTAKNMAVVEKNRKQFKESVSYYVEYDKWKDSIWNRDRIWELLEYDKKLKLAQKQVEITYQKQQKRIGWLLAIVSLLGFGLSILFFASKRRKLLHQNQLQKIQATYKEQDRISKELHDGILGKLFGTRLGLGFLNIKGDQETLKKHQSFLNIIQEIEKEIREVSHELSYNTKNTSNNFTDSIDQLLAEKSIIGDFDYQFQTSLNFSWSIIDEVTKKNIFRILQEGLHNIIKHANAKKVSLVIRLENRKLSIQLEDNGIGFEKESVIKGIGFKNIKSRIEDLKGSLIVDSTQNSGTSLFIEIPINK